MSSKALMLIVHSCSIWNAKERGVPMAVFSIGAFAGTVSPVDWTVPTTIDAAVCRASVLPCSATSRKIWAGAGLSG